MNENKPNFLSCERLWTDPFTSVDEFPSIYNNDKQGLKVKVDSDKNVNDSWNGLKSNEHCRKQTKH